MLALVWVVIGTYVKNVFRGLRRGSDTEEFSTSPDPADSSS